MPKPMRLCIENIAKVGACKQLPVSGYQLIVSSFKKGKRMFKRAIFIVVLVGVLVMSGSDALACDTCGCTKGKPAMKDHAGTEGYDGWRLGVQMWTFRKFTLFEGIDKTASLGLSTIEMFPGQIVSKETGNVKTNNMPAEVREKLKAKLKSAGIKVTNYGVVGLPNNEAGSRKVFDFAKDMGIETIVSEPGADAFDLIDKLCKEYKIKVAIHNHPKPTRYWNPDTVLKALQGRSKWIGACVDTGHLTRSGIDPVEAVKKFEGRIISLHFKDVNKFGSLLAHDVPWGTGKSKIKEVLAELDSQGFKGVFSVEYEHNWDNSVPDIRKCVEFFNKTGAELKPGGWKNLFADDLSDAVTKGKWTSKDGVLTRNGGGDLGTKEKYNNFVLDCGFKLAKNSNSGVFIRMGDRKWIPWLEIQVEDSYNEKITRHTCGGVFDILAPKVNSVKPAGQWNRLTIKAKDSKIQIVLNGEKTVDMDLNDWDTAGKNPDGSGNKFGIAYKDLPSEGYIALQDHGQAIEYRNVRILELE